jgi:hypothetical protein
MKEGVIHQSFRKLAKSKAEIAFVYSKIPPAHQDGRTTKISATKSGR